MKIRIATRKSKLALAQTDIVISAIREKFPSVGTEIIHIVTKGDKTLDMPLDAIGGKGVFIAEVEQALISGRADIAVHSAKDLPSQLAEGTTIGAVISRGDLRDVLVTRKGTVLPEIPEIGTGSQRRRAQFLRDHPHAVFSDIRGNVDTRLGKLADGRYDGIILAAAGLQRLGLDKDERFDIRYFSPDEFVPAPCQGIIAIQSRIGEFNDILTAIDHSDTHICFDTERSILQFENSDCSSPMGAYSLIEDGKLYVTVDRKGGGLSKVSGDPSRWAELAHKVWSRS